MKRIPIKKFSPLIFAIFLLGCKEAVVEVAKVALSQLEPCSAADTTCTNMSAFYSRKPGLRDNLKETLRVADDDLEWADTATSWPIARRNVEGANYVFGFMCEQHNCGGRFINLAYNEKSKSAYGFYFNEDRLYWFGEPTVPQVKLLCENSDDTCKNLDIDLVSDKNIQKNHPEHTAGDVLDQANPTFSETTDSYGNAEYLYSKSNVSYEFQQSKTGKILLGIENKSTKKIVILPDMIEITTASGTTSPCALADFMMLGLAAPGQPIEVGAGKKGGYTLAGCQSMDSYLITERITRIAIKDKDTKEIKKTLPR